MESILRCPVGAVLYNDQPSHLANFVSGDDRNRNTSIADCQWSVVRIRYSESVLVPYIVHGTRRTRAPELEYKYPHHFRLLERNHPLQSILKNTPASKQQTLHLYLQSKCSSPLSSLSPLPSWPVTPSPAPSSRSAPPARPAALAVLRVVLPAALLTYVALSKSI